MASARMVEKNPARRGAMTDTRPSLVPYAAVLVVGIVVIVLGIIFTDRFGSDPTLVASPLIGEPAADVTLETLDGDETFELSETQGDIVVVNFWASWCLACRTEHEALVQAAATYADDFDVSFVGVLIQDQASAGRAWLDELGRSPEFVYVVDDRSRASLEFGVLGVPETFFIDRDGTIVGKVSGPVNGPLLAQTIEAIALGQTADLGVVKTGEVENR